LQHPGTVFQHIRIPDAQDTIAFQIKPTVALCVARGAGMLTAVHFYDQAAVMTGKVDNVSANRRLPAEAQPIKPVRSERRPQNSLCVGHIAAKRFGATARDWRDRTMGGRLTPLPDRCAVRPPPQGGR
jgi:hypothetical protein